MTIPAGSIVAAQIAADLGIKDADTIAAFETICNRLLAAVKLATVAVPATGLEAPSGGGPVVGAASGTLS